MSEKQYAKGVIIKEKETQYGSLLLFGINKESFIQNPDNNGWVNFCVKKSKSGNPYAELQENRQ